MDTHLCTRCRQAKPLDGFSFQRGRPASWCKSCAAEWARQRRASMSVEERQALDRKNRDRARINEQQRARYRKDPERSRQVSREGGRRARERKYLLEMGVYERVFAQQGGGCALCGKPPPSSRRFHMDHDHDTGAFRGLLCINCNLLIGWLEKSVPLDKVRAYLRK